MESPSDGVVQRTNPVSPVVAIEDHTTNTIDITWTIDEDTVYDSFEIFYKADSDEDYQTDTIDGEDPHEYQLKDLTPGEKYKIEMKTHSGGETSDSSEPKQQRTKPVSPVVAIEDHTTNTIDITWTIDEDTVYDSFEIFYKADSDEDYQTDTIDGEDPHEYQLKDLTPGEKYKLK
ncbi:tyrosine-protein phosphatase 10D-like [Ptychodera flava]|uniref:tyrosine-protein phosphatase 10D-like n=1 Tax=Ptychodera flava TaxID=63121 RepID=UPI00396A527E